MKQVKSTLLVAFFFLFCATYANAQLAWDATKWEKDHAGISSIAPVDSKLFIYHSVDQTRADIRYTEDLTMKAETPIYAIRVTGKNVQVKNSDVKLQAFHKIDDLMYEIPSGGARAAEEIDVDEDGVADLYIWDVRTISTTKKDYKPEGLTETVTDLYQSDYEVPYSPGGNGTETLKSYFKFVLASQGYAEGSAIVIHKIQNYANIEDAKADMMSIDTDIPEPKDGPAIAYEFETDNEGFATQVGQWSPETSTEIIDGCLVVSVVDQTKTYFDIRSPESIVYGAQSYPYLAVKASDIEVFKVNSIYMNVEGHQDFRAPNQLKEVAVKGNVKIYQTYGASVSQQGMPFPALIDESYGAHITLSWEDPTGEVKSGKIDWVRTYATLEEIPEETFEEPVEGPSLSFEFETDNEGFYTDVNQWCPETSNEIIDGHLVVSVVDQTKTYFDVISHNPIVYGAQSYPYLAVKASNIDVFKITNFQINENGVNDFRAPNNLKQIAVKGDVVVYQTYGASVSQNDIKFPALIEELHNARITLGWEDPTGAVKSGKVDWIRTYATLEEVPEELVVSVNTEQTATFHVYGGKGQITILTDKEELINIYSVDGSLVANLMTKPGENTYAVSQGAYLVNKGKVLVE